MPDTGVDLGVDREAWIDKFILGILVLNITRLTNVQMYRSAVLPPRLVSTLPFAIFCGFTVWFVSEVPNMADCSRVSYLLA